METFVHGLAGMIGGMVAMGTLYPLDQIRTIMQVEKIDQKVEKSKRLAFLNQVLRILQERKWKIYQGHTSTQIALAGSNFVYFYCYNWLKASLVKSTRQTLSSLQNLFASYLAGILNVLITNPLWVINMRLKAKEADTKYTKGFFDCGSQIITQEGPSTLWNGTFASLILVSNPVIHFFSYETMKQKLKHHLGKSTLNALEIFLLGAFAKTWTTIITYPLQLIQTRMRVMTFSKDEQQKKVNLLSCLNQIYREDGFKGLFVGLEAKLLQTVLTASVTLVTYEKIFYLIQRILLHKTITKSVA